jgi:alkylation response protein AidB-like acyl-CoA dehydrogenase
VGGLRGTGSHDYQVANLFVPETHAITGLTPPRLGALYALPLYTVAPVTIAAVPLGIARAALDAVRALSGSKTARIGAVLLRDKPAVQAEGMLRAARAFLFEPAMTYGRPPLLASSSAWSSGRRCGYPARTSLRQERRSCR